MPTLVVYVLGGLLVTLTLVAAGTFQITHRRAQPEGGPVKIGALAQIWRAYVANMRLVLSSAVFWGALGFVTAFCIAAGAHAS